MKCKECDGKGSYEIRNAYKPEFRQVVTCEYCQGAQVNNVGAKFSDTIPKSSN